MFRRALSARSRFNAWIRNMVTDAFTENTPTEPPPAEVEAPEDALDSIFEGWSSEPDEPPETLHGLLLYEPGGQVEPLVWDAGLVLECGGAVALLDEDFSVLVPVLDVPSWEAARAMRTNGVGTFYLRMAASEPWLFVYP